MKRQDSLPSSSSHRENAAEKLHAKAVGCMSGFFHFVSGSHTRRKFLTFGKKQEKNQLSKSTTGKTKDSSSAKIESDDSPPLMVKGDSKAKDQADKTTINVLQRFSCEVPRSPTLPAEIRRSNSVNSPENFRAPPALMARLMGLEEAPAAMSKAPPPPPRSPSTNGTALAPPDYSAAADRKRRQLIGALEKCDRDLKALKKIIDAVRSAERLSSMPTTVFGSRDGGGDHHASVGNTSPGAKGLEASNYNAEQPSPVSVLEFMTPSPLTGHQYSKRQSYNCVQHHLRQQKKTKPGEEDFMIGPSIFDRLTCELLQRKPALSADLPNRKPVSFDSISAELVASLSPPSSSLPSPLWSSKAMKETVEEVCKDIDWGEKREIGRIGLALQDHIYRDLIEETVTDLGSLQSCYNANCSLPFEACKRRLCF